MTDDGFLGSCFAEVASAVEVSGLDQAKARQIATDVISRLHARYGGSRVYVRQGRTDSIRLAAKVAAVRREGVAVRDIATRFQLTESRIYQLLELHAECTEGERRRNKPIK